MSYTFDDEAEFTSQVDSIIQPRVGSWETGHRLTEQIVALCGAEIGKAIEAEFREWHDLCRRAADAFIWCSGARSFQIGGDAIEGWVKGPAQVLNQLYNKLYPQGEKKDG
jgi:hypothetical protein